MIVSMFVFQQNIFQVNVNDTAAAYSDIFIRFLFSSIFICLSLITVGPAQAGFTYLLRNYAREEHAFIWGDFKDAAINNFKQSIIISAIDLFITFLILISIRFYILMSGTSVLMVAGTSLMFLILAIFMMMHLYIYPMLVTFDLSIKQIYKNAFIFAIIKLFPNLGIILLCIILILLTFGAIIPFSPIIGLILYVFITVSLIGLITNFYVYPKLQKFMMKEEEAVEEDDDEDDEDDEDEEDEDIDVHDGYIENEDNNNDD
jgi:uncharacterized membrane protein YesL